MIQSAYPEEDSPELRDDEVAQAVPTGKLDDLVPLMNRHICPRCGKKVAVEGHKLLRRKPHLFWQVRFKCTTGHPSALLFQTTWLQGATQT